MGDVMRSVIDTTVYEILSMTWPTLLIAVVLVVKNNKQYYEISVCNGQCR